MSIVCTLFEGHYHFGVAALINSLYENGFRGDVYAGYRGKLPKWADSAVPNIHLNWMNAKTLLAADGLYLHFLPLVTDYHLTNYKPDFMLQLWSGPANEDEALFYLDPDITINAPWNIFESWVNCGVTLCEDVNSPLLEFHPKRISWKKYFAEFGFLLNFKFSTYVNGGFIGLEKKQISFLTMWKEIQEAMAIEIGGLAYSAFPGLTLSDQDQGPFAPFSRTDQDALNVCLEAWQGPASILGKEGMGFQTGTSILPHALGQPKPWFRKPLLQALKGLPPRFVDREYWKFANGVINTQPPYLVILRNYSIILAAFIGRFYRRVGI